MKINEVLQEGFADAISNVLDTARTGSVVQNTTQADKNKKARIIKIGNAFLSRWVGLLKSASPEELQNSATVQDLMSLSLRTFELKDSEDNPDLLDKLLDIGDDIVRVSSKYIDNNNMDGIKKNKQIRTLTKELIWTAVASADDMPDKQSTFEGKIMSYTSSTDHYFAQIDRPHFRNKWYKISKDDYIDSKIVSIGSELGAREVVGVENESSKKVVRVNLQQGADNKSYKVIE